MLRHIGKDCRANIAVPGIAIVAMFMAMIGGGLDLMSVSNQKSSLQDLADNAALAAVQEMAVVNGQEFRIKAIAAAYVDAGEFEIISTRTDVDMDERQVTVNVIAKPRTNFSILKANMESISASATARLSGRGGNVCMIGLSPQAISTVRVKSLAKITADSCAIYSNSQSRASVSIYSTAEVNADLICSAGGFFGQERETFNIVQDCAPIGDPLAMRISPDYSTCDFNDTRVTSTQNLQPGVYCGGLTVDGGTANLAPGEYIITGGPLWITNDGTLEGQYTGFFLAGEAAKIQFDYDANISITAPREGRMAGLLLFSSPYEEIDTSGFKDKTARYLTSRYARSFDGISAADHYIRSDNARRLVGTIYLPSGKLTIDGRDTIADRSEYTVIIADTFELQDGPNLVLRTDYHLSDIPVPKGVGPVKEPAPRLVD